MAGRQQGRSGALRRPVGAELRSMSAASPAQVYDALADLATHVTWGGERQAKTTRLTEIHADETPALVGTEFTSAGLDPMGRFEDRSVVTEAEPGRTFAFVTDARLRTTHGQVVDWTVEHRYELTPSDGGCAITYRYRVARLSAVPGALRLFNVPGISAILMKVSAGVARRGLRNLGPYVEERVGAAA